MGDETEELLRRALALPVDQREALARALWDSADAERARPEPTPEPERDPAELRRERERELDARCLRFGHLDRPVDFCANPNCPSRRPELWEAYRALGALRVEGD